MSSRLETARARPSGGSGPKSVRFRRRSWVAIIAAVAIVVVGSAVLGLRMIDGYRSLRNLTSSEVQSSTTWLYRWDRCITRLVDREVPAGSRVYVDPANPYWAQGLDSLVSPRLHTVAKLRDAQYMIGVVDAPPSTPRSERCGHEVSARVKPFPVGGIVRLVVTPRS